MKGTNTDIDGHYQLSGLPAGTYRLKASILGYASRSQFVTRSPDKPEVELPPLALQEGGKDRAAAMLGRTHPNKGNTTIDNHVHLGYHTTQRDGR